MNIQKYTLENFNLQKVAPWAAFLLIFLFYTYPMGLSDYWWHLNTGRLIWETFSIPGLDHFSYAIPQDDDIRRVVIQKAYYSGQVLFYFIYSLLGIWGLLFLKASLLTFSLWILWRFLCYKQVSPVIALILILPLPIVLYRFDELRTVIFSFIGAISVLYLIEKSLDRFRSGQTLGLFWFALPAAMLLWANSHRGFLIGWALLGFFIIGESYKYYRSAGNLSKKSYQSMLVLFVLSILISILNPNGINPFVANFTELGGPFVNVVDEFFSLWHYADIYNSWIIFYGCLVVAIFAALVMLRQWREVELSHGLLFVGFFIAGIATFRFSYFLVFMALALSAPYFARLSQHLYQKYKSVVTLLCILSLFGMAYVGVVRSALLAGPLESAYFPESAVKFIQKNKPPGNIFNAFEYGGYLGWELYPEYKIFTDQRNLDYKVYQKYHRARSGNYQPVFAEYNVNTVVFYIEQPVLGKVPRIVGALLQDSNWNVAHIDRVAIVFVRRSVGQGLPALNKVEVINYINSRHN